MGNGFSAPQKKKEEIRGVRGVACDSYVKLGTIQSLFSKKNLKM